VVGRLAQPVRRLPNAVIRWAAEKKYIHLNPFAHVKPVGKANKGKEQLRIDEARRLTKLLVSESREGKRVATAILTQLMLGWRSLRGLHSTLAVASGCTSGAVASALGPPCSEYAHPSRCGCQGAD
jgi:hypothetical protein